MARRRQSSRGGTLRGHRGFRRLWLGQTVSEVGSQVTLLAAPLVAVSTLHATTFQVGLLASASTAAFLVVGLPAGALVDRMRHRRVMIVADLVRAGLILSIPVAAWTRALTLLQLLLVALLSGFCTVFFDVAYQSYLPGLVGRDALIEGNAKLQTTASIAGVGGPSLAGLLVQAFTGPIAMLADSISFLVSACAVGAIRESEAEPPPRPARRPLVHEIGEGLRFVLGHPILRMIAGSTSTGNLFSSAWNALAIVFLVRHVGLRPGTIGVLFAIGASGGIVGALASSWLARKIGSARIIWVSIAACTPPTLLIPATSRGWGISFFAVGVFFSDLGSVVYNVNQVSFRQSLCPPLLLGRMNATMRFIVWGTLPLGGIMGGALGAWLGTVPALWIAVSCEALALIWLLASPLRRMRDLPAPPGAPEPIGTRSA